MDDALGRWFCEICGSRYQENTGDCPKCPEEPLLDLRTEEVVDFLKEQDHKRFVKKTAIMSVISGIVMGFALVVGSFGAMVAVGVRPNFWLFIALWGFGTLGMSAGLMRLMPAKKITPLDVLQSG